MNEFISTLIKRRSIRNFKPEQISEEELNDILLAGLHAPSAKNGQPVIFLVVQDKELRAELVKMNQDVTGKYEADPYHAAPTVIVVLAYADSPTGVEDASLALGNMYNAAYSLGLGECWINREKEIFKTDCGKAFLKKAGVEHDVIGVGALSVGYPDTEFVGIKSIKPGRVFRA